MDSPPEDVLKRCTCAISLDGIVTEVVRGDSKRAAKINSPDTVVKEATSAGNRFRVQTDRTRTSGSAPARQVT
jgi:hypothetical protein